MGKEESAGYQHFLHFPQCFQKAFTSIASKWSSCGKGQKNDKTVDQSKMKGFADDKVNVNKKIKSVLGRVENNFGKRRKCLLTLSKTSPGFSVSKV